MAIFAPAESLPSPATYYVATGKVARNPGGYSTIDSQLRVIWLQ